MKERATSPAWWSRLFLVNGILVAALLVWAVLDSVRPFSDAEIASGSSMDTYGVQYIISWRLVLPLSAVGAVAATLLAAKAVGGRLRLLSLLQLGVVVVAAMLVVVSLQRLERRVLPRTTTPPTKVL